VLQREDDKLHRIVLLIRNGVTVIALSGLIAATYPLFVFILAAAPLGA